MLDRRDYYAWMLTQGGLTAKAIGLHFGTDRMVAGKMLRGLRKLGATSSTIVGWRTIWTAVPGVELYERRGNIANLRRQPPAVRRETEDGTERFCPGCEAWWPETTDNFYVHRGHKRVCFSSKCKTCHCEAVSKRYKPRKDRPVKVVVANPCLLAQLWR